MDRCLGNNGWALVPHRDVYRVCGGEEGAEFLGIRELKGERKGDLVFLP